MEDGEEWLARLAVTAPGQAVVLAVVALVFVAVPDVDLLLLRLLHHRSILTHSVLPALLVLWWGRAWGPAAAAGAALGVAVHLAADLLSPARGFGAVWLPEPMQVSLGRWSPLWLLANALLAAWLAVALLPDGEGWRALSGVVGALLAVGYGALNERSGLAAVVALTVVAAGQGVERWLNPGAAGGL